MHPDKQRQEREGGGGRGVRKTELMGEAFCALQGAPDCAQYMALSFSLAIFNLLLLMGHIPKIHSIRTMINYISYLFLYFLVQVCIFTHSSVWEIQSTSKFRQSNEEILKQKSSNAYFYCACAVCAYNQLHDGCFCRSWRQGFRLWLNVWAFWKIGKILDWYPDNTIQH